MLNTIFQYLIKGMWYLLPAVCANIAPIFARNIFKDTFSTPVDLHKKFLGKRLFGRTKTYRGFVFGIIAGILGVLVQRYYFQFPGIQAISYIDYSSVNIYLLGFLMGFGGLFGDLIKSFFKRRLNIKSSRSWIPFDQIDFGIGALIFCYPLGIPDWKVITTLFIIGPVVSLMISRVGYILKIRKVKY